MSNNPAGFYVHRSAIEAHKRFVGPHVTITKLANGELLESFYNCTDANIDTVKYRKDVEHIDLSTSPLLTEIPIRFFNGSITLKSVKIGNGITKIKEEAFFQCSNLAQFNFTGNITDFEKNAFAQCHNLTEINLANAITLGYGAFARAEKIEHLYLPSTITQIGDYAFSNWHDLKTIEVASTILGTGQRIFMSCALLEKVWIRNTCETITVSQANQTHFINCPTTIKIYAEPASKPSGWSQYFNRTGLSGGTTVSVVYGQTTSPF